MSKSQLPVGVWVAFGLVILVVVGATAAGAAWYLTRLRPAAAAPPEVVAADPADVTVQPPVTAPVPAEPKKAEAPPSKTPDPAPIRPANPGTNPVLREVPVAAPAAPAAAPTPVVYLEPPPLAGPKDPITGLLRRELHRQALLLAARDELGLATRDGVLGEMPPAALPGHQRLVVSAELTVGRPHRVRIEAGPGREVWRAEGAGPAVADEAPAAALVLAEEFSRGGYVTALTRAGWKGAANKTDPTGAVPPEVDGWLGQMTFPTQFYALRALHAAARANGESPGLVGALSRAYAHLGMLTDAQWGSLTWVFKARGLLYAQRLVTRDPGGAWGLWHRAYAEALTGMHAAALEDLKAAAAARGGSAGAPDWVALTDALCRFDSAKLKGAFADPKLGETARVFHFLTVESAGSPTQAGRAGLALLLKYPECDRVHDGLSALGIAERAGIPSAAYRGFTERFTRRVREAPGLPKAVADLAPKAPPEPDLVRALVEAGDPAAGPGEPSWAALGRFAQETRVVQVAGRLRFLKDDLKAPADKFFQQAAPLVSGHPVYPFLESYAIDAKRWPDEHKSRLRADRVPALSYRHLPLVLAQERLGREHRVRANNVAQIHGDWLYHDAAVALRAMPPGADTSQYARRAIWVSPHAPAIRAALLTHDPAVPAPLVATWEAEAQHPEVLEALAGRAFRAGRWEDAEKLSRRATELEAGATLFRLRAELYRARGDTGKWLATLEEFLKTEDTGLDHARVRVDLAEHFRAAKDHRRALAYAEAAAESGAPFALRAAARCAEAAGEWAKAEEFVRRLSEQFPDAVGVWMLWCHRTGRGDPAAAARLVEERLSHVRSAPAADDLIVAAALRALTGQPDLAPGLLEAAHQKERDDGALLLAASLCDTQKDDRGRDRYLALIGDRGTYTRAKRLLLNAQGEGEDFVPGPDRLDEVINFMPPAGRGLVCYVGGMYALRRGDRKVAAEYLARAVAEGEGREAVSAALAAVALRGMEKK